MRPQPWLFLGLVGVSAADPTWPSDSDDLEEIMFQLFDFKARNFADRVYPCDKSRFEPGRNNPAEFLRTAFHDMAAHNRFTGIGGMDASVQYELDRTENAGPAISSSLGYMSPYLSRKTSMADLIATGVYSAVRACDGPSIPIRHGRRDASDPNGRGIPAVDNSTASFRAEFFRMGLNPVEMIQLVACGHTLGGVHSQTFPQINPPGTHANEFAPLDSTNTRYDNQGVVEYLGGTTDNPLVRGPSASLGQNSDLRIFSSDGNATIRAMADPNAFKGVCRNILQKMLDSVPSGVALSGPVEPYVVKPVDMQLTLQSGGESLLWTGYIRVRTTGIPVGEISSVGVTFKNRNSGADCGSFGCSVEASMAGTGSGYDDSFAVSLPSKPRGGTTLRGQIDKLQFFGIKATIPVDIGIGSFIVTITKTSGEKLNYNNNGNSYPMQDGILLQLPQSCASQSGSVTVVAAIRNDLVNNPAKTSISYKTVRSGLPVAGLQETVLDMRKGDCVGSYTLFKVETSVPGGLSSEARLDVMSGEYVDGFKLVGSIGGDCADFDGAETCGDVAGPVSKSSSSSTPSPTLKSTKKGTTATTSPIWPPSPSSTSSWPVKNSTTSISSTGSPWLVKPTTSWQPTKSSTTTSNEWKSKSSASKSTTEKWTTTTASSSAWKSTAKETWKPTTSPWTTVKKSTSTSTSTLSTPASKSTTKPSYKPTTISTAKKPPSTTSTPAFSPPPTAVPNPTFTPLHPTQPARIGSYAFLGCISNVGIPILPLTLKPPTPILGKMHNELCAGACKGHPFFGTEGGDTCWCGDVLDGRSVKVEEALCDVACEGDKGERCGGMGRLSVYVVKT